MRIGIVTTWFERGAAYVSSIYKNLLESEGHKVYIFARGGDPHPSQKDEKWNDEYVTRSSKYTDTRIPNRIISKWIREKALEAILFNEQRDYRVLVYVKTRFPHLKIGSYVDYYTENTIEYYGLYDFLICNTKRHMQALDRFDNKYYVEWGTDTEIYKPENKIKKQLTFFHSAGMATRKGTDILIEAFIKGGLFVKSKLIIHTQIPIEKLCAYNEDELKKYNIEIICKTVGPPGLYSLGDVYVYPAKLDGLGLTMYEAISCGLPLIVSDFPPMNEVGDDKVVRLVGIRDYICRSDAYYYPMCICDSDSLISHMQWFIDNILELSSLKKLARQFALEHYDIRKKSKVISDIFVNTSAKLINPILAAKVKRMYSIRARIIDYLRKYVVFDSLLSKLHR